MSNDDIVGLAIAISGLPFLIVALVMAVKMVPAGQVLVVQRLGRHHRTLQPGLNLIVPLVDRVTWRLDTRLRVVPLRPVSATTRDHRPVTVELTVYTQVVDPVKAVYGVADATRALEEQAHNTVRSLVGQLDRAALLSSHDQIGLALHQELGALARTWGSRVDRVLVNAAAATDDRAPTAPAAPAASPAAGSGSPTAPAHLPLADDDPRRVGRYDILARLGEGGMGVVYLGRTPAPDSRPVAIKVIRGQFATDETFRRRFAREVETARRVGGAHTASVEDADPIGNPPWLVTEYIAGPSLDHVIARHGALPGPTLFAVASGVAHALAGIHASGIIHRDLKPNNIIISATGPRVIDFGIARAIDATALTRTGHVIGTPGFLAPEQLTGGTTTPATDLYAYGMVLCHAAGVAPLLQSQQPLEVALGMLPEGLRDLVQRCLATDPASRPGLDEIIKRLDEPSAAATAAAQADAWLPPPIRTMVDQHAAHTRQTVWL